MAEALVDPFSERADPTVDAAGRPLPGDGQSCCVACGEPWAERTGNRRGNLTLGPRGSGSDYWLFCVDKAACIARITAALREKGV